MKRSHSVTDSNGSTACPRTSRLGELLREKGLITAAQLTAALEHQKSHPSAKKLGEILVASGALTSADLVRVLAETVGIPHANLSPDVVRPEAMRCLPPDFLEKHNVLPLSMSEGWLTIAVEQFTDVILVEDIARRSSCEVQVIAAEAENIRQTRAAVQRGVAQPAARTADEAGPGLEVLLSQIGVDDLQVVERESHEDDAVLEAAATDSPVIKLVNYIIQNAVDGCASDIHIEPDESCLRVRFRIDGDLVDAVRPPLRLLPAVVSRIKIMAGMDISERRLPQDGSVTVTLGNRPIDLRVSTMTTRFGEKVVMRIVDREASIRSLDSIGFEAAMLEAFRAIVHVAHGIVLVTGPTGSGKSTTLYAVLAELVSDKLNISTIEDPVERRLRGTNQFQIHTGAGFTFGSALRSLLRQDPDVVMVGEVRDAETAKLATEAALTGHLVLSTLHTNDAPTAIPRLVNMGVEPYLVAATLRGVIAQRLVRRLCQDCRQPAPMTSAEREALTLLCAGKCPIDKSYKGKGCLRCRNSGCSGRIGVFELLRVDEAILSVITADPSMRSVRHSTPGHIYSTLLQDGLQKVQRGFIHVSGLLEIVSSIDSSDSMRLDSPRAAA